MRRIKRPRRLSSRRGGRTQDGQRRRRIALVWILRILKVSHALCCGSRFLLALHPLSLSPPLLQPLHCSIPPFLPLPPCISLHLSDSQRRPPSLPQPPAPDATPPRPELDKVFEQARDFAEQTLWVGFPSPLPTIRSGLDMVRLNHNDTLLDLGCGDGRVCMIAAQEYGAAAFGVDVDEISLGYAEQVRSPTP